MQKPIALGAFLAIVACATLLPSRAMAERPGEPPTPSIIHLFSNGDGGFPRFRIPALLALDNGALLAFAEGRRPTFEGQHDDHARNNIVLRRSVDGGESWEPLQIVARMNDDSLNDPCVVFLPDTGRVLLMFQRFPEGYHARRMVHTEVAELGYGGPRNTQTFLTYSDDDGATWSEPRDITSNVRAEDAISVGSPGVGIVLRRGEHSGRILLPLYEVIPQGDDEERYWRNRMAISDDGGESWRVGERVPIDGLTGFGNECQIAELADGSIRMNARLQTGANRVARSISHDGGETWSAMEEEPGLVTTPCMTSLVAHPDVDSGEVRLLASLPNSEDGRENGTVFMSRDGGASWPYRHTLYERGFAYSSLAVMPDGRVAAFFELGPYTYLSFTTFGLEELELVSDDAEQ